MEDVIISKITDVKYTGSSSPTDIPFWATIKATSPRVIIPTPTLIACLAGILQAIDISPQPIILVSKATATKPRENTRIDQSIFWILVFKPILAKKIGPNIT